MTSAGHAKGRPCLPQLMLITDASRPERVLDRTRAALEGLTDDAGLLPSSRVAVQLRDKTSSARALLDLAKELRVLTGDAGCQLLINGRADVALAVDADGVHLPETGVEASRLRTLCGDRLLIGRSCHDRAGLLRALEEGADYALLSPFFTVPSKGAPLDRAELATWGREMKLPWLALGGIDPIRVAESLEYGATGVAVVRAVYAAEEPRRALDRFRRALVDPASDPQRPRRSPAPLDSDSRSE